MHSIPQVGNFNTGVVPVSAVCRALNLLLNESSQAAGRTCAIGYLAVALVYMEVRVVLRGWMADHPTAASTSSFYTPPHAAPCG